MGALERLATRLTEGRAVVAGCLSGTSADGIDVALTRFPDGVQGAPRMLAFDTLPFEPALEARVRHVLDGGTLDLGQLARLSRDLGLAFGDAVARVAGAAGLEVELVGSHGQTVWHHDGHGAGSHDVATLQLGEGAWVARAARATVVNDFRQADLAAGGEGAPLAALADHQLFGGLPRPAALLNLGGMANLTCLDERGGGVAFDTGPAGSLLDGLARRLLDRPFDAGGAVAATGRPDGALLAELDAHPFLARRPPKSTGRDTFGEAWVEGLVARARAAGLLAAGPAHLLATAVEWVAGCVATQLERFGPTGVRVLVVAGGGVHHGPLLAALSRRTGLEARTAAEYGVDPDAREALLFAVLAQRAILAQPSSAPWATGARPGAVLGAIHPAPARRATERSPGPQGR